MRADRVALPSVLVWVVVGCGTVPSTPTPTTAPTEEASASASDSATPSEGIGTNDETSVGSGFVVVPRGFRWKRWSAGRLEMTVPEGDARVFVFVDDGELDVDEAGLIASAWTALEPRFVGQPEALVTEPPERGWTAITSASYPVDVEHSRVRQAVVFTRDAHRFVVCIEGTMAAFQRRGAQVATIVASLRTDGIGTVSWAGRTVVALDEGKRRELREFVERAMRELEVPGAAIGYVHGDEEVLEAFGVRALGGRDAVTADTLFMIGSITKSFLTLLQARLVDRGIVRWDQPVRELLPEFDLADHDLAARLELRHTVCACTGMPRRDVDMLFEIDRRTPETFVRELATFTPTTAFGETFQYSNHLVTVGGYATVHRLHPRLPLVDAWDRAAREELFVPMGMRSSTTRLRDALRREHAAPHAQDLDGHTRAIDPRVEAGIDAVGPCGSIWSTARDMIRYLRVNLASGALPDGSRLVSEARFRERITPQVEATRGVHYALGIGVDTTREVASLGHRGATFGFAADHAFVPDLDFGYAVLTNTRGAEVFVELVTEKLTELVVGRTSTSSAEDRLDLVIRERVAARERELSRTTLAPDLAALREWVGRYATADGLDFDVREEAGRLVLDEGVWTSRLGLQDEGSTPHFILLDAPFAGLRFRLVQDDPASLVLDVGQTVYRFVRSPAPRARRR